jgi:hypothetical protein
LTISLIVRLQSTASYMSFSHIANRKYALTNAGMRQAMSASAPAWVSIMAKATMDRGLM